ncbi:hypothetical protein [Simkania sp.]|uniref:hypothetical protein n=1 Tax=Simkania sp. TaxID=34094 RepID=UPI003B51DC66
MSVNPNGSYANITMLYAAALQEFASHGGDDQSQRVEESSQPVLDIQVHFKQCLYPENQHYVGAEMPQIIANMLVALGNLDLSHNISSAEDFGSIAQNLVNLDTQLQTYQRTAMIDEGFEHNFKLRLEPFWNTLANKAKEGLVRLTNIDNYQHLMDYCNKAPRRYAIDHLERTLKSLIAARGGRQAKEQLAINFLRKMLDIIENEQEIKLSADLNSSLNFQYPMT